MTFTVENKYRQNHIYLQIKKAKEARQSGEDVPYSIWTLAIQESRDKEEETARAWADYNVQQEIMQEDPAAFNLGAVNQDIQMNSSDSEEAGDCDGDSVDSSLDSETDDRSSLQQQINQNIGAASESTNHLESERVNNNPINNNTIQVVDRGFIESKGLELNLLIANAQEQMKNSVKSTEKEIFSKQESSEQNVLDRIGDMEQILMEKNYTVDELKELKSKLREVQLARDQEEQKRASVTQACNKAMKEKDQVLKQLRLVIQALKQSAQFSKILKSIDQKLGTGMAELQAAMRFYEDSDNSENSEDNEPIPEVHNFRS